MSVRQALESLYEGLCTITTKAEKVNTVTKRTEFTESTLVTNQPCRLSYSTLRSSGDGDASEVLQVTKLFLAPEFDVPAGSKITVTQNGKTANFQRSGEPAVHANHQEITLELFKGWA